MRMQHTNCMREYVVGNRLSECNGTQLASLHKFIYTDTILLLQMQSNFVICGTHMQSIGRIHFSFYFVSYSISKNLRSNWRFAIKTSKHFAYGSPHSNRRCTENDELISISILFFFSLFLHFTLNGCEGKAVSTESTFAWTIYMVAYTVA